MYLVLQLEHHCVVHDTLQSVNDSDVIGEHDREQIVVTAGHSNHARRQHYFIFLADGPDIYLVKLQNQFDANGSVESSQHFDVIPPFLGSNIAVI